MGDVEKIHPDKTPGVSHTSSKGGILLHPPPPTFDRNNYTPSIFMITSSSIVRIFLILTLSGFAMLSRVSVSPVIEFEDGRSTIAERLVIRDPTTTEFLITLSILVAVGTASERFLMDTLLRGFFRMGKDSHSTHQNRPQGQRGNTYPQPYQQTPAALPTVPGRSDPAPDQFQYPTRNRSPELPEQNTDPNDPIPPEWIQGSK